MKANLERLVVLRSVGELNGIDFFISHSLYRCSATAVVRGKWGKNCFTAAWHNPGFVVARVGVQF